MGALDNLVESKAQAGGQPVFSALDSLVEKKGDSYYKPEAPKPVEPKKVSTVKKVVDKVATTIKNKMPVEDRSAEIALGDKTKGFAPGAGGGTPFDFHVVTPRYKVTQETGMERFMSTFKPKPVEAGKETVNGISQVAEGTFNTLNDLFDFGIGFTKKLNNTLNSWVDKKTGVQTVQPNAERLTSDDLVKGLSMVGYTAAQAAHIAFAPISAELTAAERSGIPGISQMAYLTNIAFEKMGPVGSYLTGKALDMLPVSDKTKGILREPFEELGAIALPLLVGKGAVPAVEKIASGKRTAATYVPDGKGGYTGMIGEKPTAAARATEAIAPVVRFALNPLTESARGLNELITKKTEQRQKAGENVDTPEVAKQIVREAVQETKVDVPGEMVIRRANEQGEVLPDPPVRIYTDQKLVLRYLTPGLEPVNFEVKRNIKDPQGNPVDARYEFDYETKQHTFYVKDAKTAALLARETGNRLEEKTRGQVEKVMSEAFPEYRVMKDTVNSELAAYATEKLKGKASSAEINREVESVIKNFDRQARKLSPNGFTGAILAVQEGPRKARAAAPDLAPFLEYSMKNGGIVAKRLGLIGQDGSATASRTEIAPEGTAPKVAQPEEATAAKKEVKAAAEPIKQPRSEALQSRAFERVKEQYAELAEVDASYRKMNIAQDVARALDFVESQPESARRVALGLDTPPTGVTETAVSIAYAESLRSQGKWSEYAQAERSRSLRQTRRGQEIAAERGRTNENSPDHFIQQVIRARLARAGKGLATAFRSPTLNETQSYASRGTERMAEETTALKRQVTKEKLEISEAQKVLDSLTCK